MYANPSLWLLAVVYAACPLTVHTPQNTLNGSRGYEEGEVSQLFATVPN